MSSFINDAIINNYNTNNLISVKLSGKGIKDTSNANNIYDYNGLGVYLWSNTSNYRELAFVDSSNTSNYPTLCLGVIDNSIKINNGSSLLQINDCLSISNKNIGIEITNPYTALHIKSNITISGSLLDINNNVITNNLWNSIANKLSYTKGFIGIGTNSPNSLLEIANGNIIISSNYKIGIGLTSLKNAFDIYNNDVRIENGAFICSNLGIGNTNPKSTLDINGDIMLSGNIVNVDGTPYVFKTSNMEQWSNSPFNYDNIYYNSGFVGIGLTNPSSALEVKGNVNIDGNIIKSDGTIFNSSSWNDNNTSIYYNCNVGIGISEPLYILDVSSLSSNNSNLNIRFSDLTTNYTSNDGFIVGLDNNQNGLLWNYENQSIILGNNNKEILQITKSGNIGIGTTNPQSLLHLSSNSNNCNVIINIDNNLIIGKDSNQCGLLWNYCNADLSFGTSNTERLKIKNNLLIGIGTNNPNNYLHLYKSGTILQDVLCSFDNQGTSSFVIGKNNNNDGLFWNSNNNPLTFKTNNVERLRIANNGNIGVGIANPLSLLHLSASTATTNVLINIDNNIIIGKDNNQNGLLWNSNDSSIIFGNNNSEKMRINANFKIQNHNELKTLFTSKKTWGMYFAEDYNSATNTLLDSSGSNNHATCYNTINKTTASGNGASLPITYIYGDTNAYITFPSGSVPETFTILSLSRYTGATKRRILTNDGDWLHGHWNERRGVCFYEGWKTSTSSTGTLTDWLCCIGKNSGTTPNNILIDGTASGTNSGGSGNRNLTINGLPSDSSDWAVSCIMIWDRALSDDEMQLLNTMINYYKSSGFNIKNYISNFFGNNNSTYNIGIGIDNPNSLLHLYKSGSVSQDVLCYFNDQGTSSFVIGKNNNNDGLFWNSNNNPLTFKTNNVERLRIANNGNIGIGNANPLSLLHLSASTATTNVLINIDNNIIIGKDNNQNGLFMNNSNTDLIFGNNNSEKMRIKNNSLIGIGINNPNNLLHLYKSGAVSLDVLCSFDNQGTSSFVIGKNNNNDGLFWNSNNNSLTFKTNSLERLTILNNGNIGINVSSPQYLLDVNGNINIEGGISLNSSSAFINTTNVDAINTSNTYLILKHAGSTNDWCYIRQTGSTDSYKLSFDFFDNANDSRFAIRYIIPSASTDTVKEVFKVDGLETYANGLKLNGENTTNTIEQTITENNLGITVNDINNYISFNVATNEIMRITSENININKTLRILPYNNAYQPSKSINGSYSDTIIFKQGIAGSAYPYSLGSTEYTSYPYSKIIYYSIPDNSIHKFYINGNEYLNIRSSNVIAYNNIQINNNTNPSLSFTSYPYSDISVASTDGSYSSSATSGDMIIRSQAGKRLILQSGANEGHLIINNGKIGIGTNNPASVLDIRGESIRLSGNIVNKSGVAYKIDTGAEASLTSTNLILNTNVTASIAPTYNYNNKYYFFESNGTITFNITINADILLVGAGGNGGLRMYSGGGGAGEVIYYPNYTFTQGTYNLFIGGSSINSNNRITKITSNSIDLVKALGGGDGSSIDIIGYPIVKDINGNTINPIIWYKFDNSASIGSDSMNYINLVQQSSYPLPTYDTTTLIRGSGSINFAQGQVLAQNYNYSDFTTAISISFWIRINGYGTYTAYDVIMINQANQLLFLIARDGASTNLQIAIFGSGYANSVHLNGLFTVNYTWKHAVLIAEKIGTSVKITSYLNSELNATSTSGTWNISGLTQLILGNNILSLIANIDDLRFYNVVLTQAQIIELYGGGTLKNATSGGSGGGGKGGYDIQLGASSGIKWNNSYSYINDGSTGTASKGGDGGSALLNGSFTELITQKNIKVGKGGLGVGSILYDFLTIKKNYGDGGDGGGGLGGNGLIIIKPNSTNNLITNNTKLNSLNNININNNYYQYDYIYPSCSCNVNYIDNSNYGYYIITSPTLITFKKNTTVDILLVGTGGNGGSGNNSGGGGAGEVLYFPNYTFSYGVFNFYMDLNIGAFITQVDANGSLILTTKNGNNGKSSVDNSSNQFSGSGGGGFATTYNGSYYGDSYYEYLKKTSALDDFGKYYINDNKQYYIYKTAGKNGTASSGGDGGSALPSGGFIEPLTGTNIIVGVGGKGAIGGSVATIKTGYGYGGDGNGGLGTGGVIIIKFPIEKISICKGYETINNTYFKTINNINNINNEANKINLINNCFIGIGTTNPLSSLHVNSNIALGGTIYKNRYSTDPLIINSSNNTNFVINNNTTSNINISKGSTTFNNNNVYITGNLTITSGNITVTSGCNINIKSGGYYKRGGTNVVVSSTTFSDYRIKTNTNDINNSNSCYLLSAIAPKTYNYIDKEERGYDKVYGFIAQQIEEVIPQAVKIETQFIPNIYKSFICDNNNNQIITDEDLTSLLMINDKIKFKDNDNYYKTANIINITSNNITVNTLINGSNCFIYGKEVNDFHTLDKSFIYTVNVGATQDLYNKIKLQEKQLQELNAIYEKQEQIFNEISQSLNI